MPEHLKDDGWVTLAIAIPPELVAIGVADDVQRFVDFMVYKLRRNHHKGRFEGVPLEAAWADLQGEVAELEGAIKAGSTAEIWMESADIANQALIVAAVAHEAKRARSPSPQPAPRTAVGERTVLDGGLRPHAVVDAGPVADVRELYRRAGFPPDDTYWSQHG